MRNLISILAMGILLSLNGFSQVTNNQVINFNSGLQNMFDPASDPTPYTINEYFSLPPGGPFTWNYSATIGDSWSTGSLDLGPFGTFGGFSFSASFTAGTWGALGFEFEVKDFTPGEIEVKYPVNITTTSPTPNSYSCGEWIYLETDYTVLPTHELNTYYPTGGEVNLNLYADVNAEISATIGLSGLGIGGSYTVAPVDLHTSDYLGGQSVLNFMHLDEDTSYYFGYANTGGATAPGYPNPSVPAYLTCTNLSAAMGNCDPGQVYQTNPSLPISTPNIFGNPVPFSATATVPYVETTESIVGDDLYASGDSTYFIFSSPILAMVLGLFGVPGEVLSGAIQEDIGMPSDLEISWVLAQLNLDFLIVHHQEFDFKPTIYGKFNFPTPVEYQIWRNGSLNSSGISSQINYMVGDSVRFRHPCFYDNLTIARTYSIDGQFHSKTYDSFDFNLYMEAAGLKVDIPGFNIIPSYTWEVCIPWGYPCGDVFWPSWCSGETCTGFTTPSVSFPAISFNTCQLYSSMGLSPGTNFGNYNPANCAFVYFNETWPAWTNLWHENTWPLIFEENPGDPNYDADSLFLSGRPLLASASTAPIPCNGQSGSVNVVIQNGVGPYNIVWSNGVTQTGVASNFSSPAFNAGNYIASITDANGCQTVTGTIIIEPTAPLALSSSVTNASCNGSSTGAIDLTVNGGTAAYSYGWSTADGSGLTPGSQDQSGLTAGTYLITVTDNNLCTVNTSILVSEPAVLQINTATIQDVDCFGSATGSINVAMQGGTQPYSYSWDTSPASGVIGTQPSVSGLVTNVYALTVTDIKNCQYTQLFNIVEPSALLLSTTVINEDCFGNSIGEIDLTASGGAPATSGAPYIYLWYNPSGQLMSNTTEDISGLPAGNYDVIVRDTNGCTAQIQSTITEPTELIISGSTLVNVACFGNSTGLVDIEVQGGTGGYTYDWDNDGTGDSDDAQDLSNIAAGSYNVSILDANGCNVTEGYTITEPAQGLSASSMISDVGCFGESTGAIDITVLGGTVPYLYDWDNDGTGDNDDNQDLNSIVANGYNVTITDMNGCVLAVNEVVNEPAQIVLSETHADVLCYDGNSGSIDLTVVGGITPYSYQWSDGASLILTPTTQDLSSLTSDTYLVFVEDANSCVDTLSISVGQPLAPISLTSVVLDVDCFGSSSGGIDLSVLGGTGPYTFDWDNDGVGDNNDPEDLGSLIAGQYIVIVTDDNGCQETLTAIINEPSIPIIASVFAHKVNCFGEATGAMDLTVSGGTGPYTFDWDNDGVGDNDDTEDIENLLSGIYTVIITDMNGCTQSVGGFVSQPNQALTISTVVIEPSCFEYEDGSINLTITGGTTPYYVEWGNQFQFLMNNPSELLSGLGDGDYFFRITDKNDCVFEANVIVGQPDTLEVDFAVVDVSCYEGSDGTITLTPNGGTPPYNYIWSNSSTNQNQINLVTNYYNYVLTDDNGCIFEQSIFVDQAPEINIYEEIIPLSCIDQNDAGIIVQTAGGTQPYTWVWSNGEFTENVNDLMAGQYQLTITDDFGCQKVYDFIVSASNIECVYIVNTFTPNGDNYNDTWVIDNLYLYPNAEVKVFNRWGNLLFESQGEYTPWDGTYQGNPLPSEVYYYIIVLNNGVDNKYTGTITIVR